MAVGLTSMMIRAAPVHAIRPTAVATWATYVATAAAASEACAPPGTVAASPIRAGSTPDVPASTSGVAVADAAGVVHVARKPVARLSSAATAATPTMTSRRIVVSFWLEASFGFKFVSQC